MEQAFEITVTARENATWQGVLTAPDGGQIPFRSELELLLELDRRLPPGPDAHPDDTQTEKEELL